MTHTTPQPGGPAPSVNGHAGASVNGNSSASTKDQKPEPESVFWDVPDPEKAQAESAAKELPARKITIDGDFYRRAGFYSALNKSSEQEFRHVIQRLHKSVEDNIANLTKELNADLERFKNGKTDADEKIAEIKTLLARYEQQVDDLKDELLLHKARFEELRDEIKAALIEIGTKKETLIKDRQDALFQELNRLNSELENVVKKRMNLNEEIFEKQKAVLQKKRDFLHTLFEKYDGELKQVMEKLKLFNIPGFQFLSSTFLYNTGLIAATVAGGFFGSFAEANSLASGGAFSFVIQSLFNFSTAFLTQDAASPRGKLLHAGFLLAVFLGLLGLMFVVSGLCEWAYQKLVVSRLKKKSKPKGEKGADEDEEREESDFSFNFEANENLPLVAKIAGKNFFVFWLRLLPFMLFLAIVFILVSLGTDVAAMKSLDASVAGYGVGFLIAVASAGLSYIYLTMFLERRIEQQLKNQQEIRWARLNLELLGVVLAFIAVVMITLLGFKYPFQSGTSTQSIVSFMFFVAACLITAFTLSFGIRLGSLQTSRAFLVRQCDHTQNWIIRLSRPLQIYLNPIENAHFNHKFILIRDEIMNLMLERTTLTRNAAKTPLVQPAEKKPFFAFANLGRWWKKLSWRNPEATEKKEQAKEPVQDQSPQHEPGTLSTSVDVKLAFPKLEAELTSLEAEADEVRSRIASVEREIRFRTEQKGDFYIEKTADLKHQEVRSRNYHKAMTNREKQFHHAVEGERGREQFFVQKIVEGYELGDWFKKHGKPNTVIPDLEGNGNVKDNSNRIELDTPEA